LLGTYVVNYDGGCTNLVNFWKVIMDIGAPRNTNLAWKEVVYQGIG
jgi:hypothetical protein